MFTLAKKSRPFIPLKGKSCGMSDTAKTALKGISAF